jgi:hypothetical protein
VVSGAVVISLGAVGLLQPMYIKRIKEKIQRENKEQLIFLKPAPE